MGRDLTTGSIFGNVVRFSLPYLLSYFLQTLYGMADLFIIGQYAGVKATTAVSVGSQVMHMLTVMIVGLAMGTTVSIAQAIGAKDRARASAATGNTAALFLPLSVLLAGVLLLLRGAIVSVMATPAQARAGAEQYLTICFLGIPFITAYNIISAIFRGMGDSKSPMYFILIACLANIGLDYLFMGALHMGPAGAALGTTLSQALSVAAALTVIIRRRLLRVGRAVSARVHLGPLFCRCPVQLQRLLLRLRVLRAVVPAQLSVHCLHSRPRRIYRLAAVSADASAGGRFLAVRRHVSCA